MLRWKIKHKRSPDLKMSGAFLEVGCHQNNISEYENLAMRV
nr:MAG TPA: hypothetical protein [Caudoviricetes sp.]